MRGEQYAAFWTQRGLLFLFWCNSCDHPETKSSLCLIITIITDVDLYSIEVLNIMMSRNTCKSPTLWYDVYLILMQTPCCRWFCLLHQVPRVTCSSLITLKKHDLNSELTPKTVSASQTSLSSGLNIYICCPSTGCKISFQILLQIKSKAL